MDRNAAASVIALLASALPALGEGQGAAAALYLRAGTVDTAQGAGPLAGEIVRAGASRYVIQLDGPITPQRRARLAGAGIRLGDYLPLHAYIVTLEGADAARVAGLEFIRWWSPFRAEWKLDPELGRRAYVTPGRLALARQGRDLLTVVTFPGQDAAVEKAVFATRGAEILSEDLIAGHVELTVRVSLADAPRLAALPGVQFVEPAPEVTPRSNLTTRWIVQSNIAGNFPLYANGIHGENQVIGILDGRVDINHCSFLDAAHPVGPLHRKVAGMQSTGAADLHGTHVAGIAVGDGGFEDNTRGVAYLARLSWGTYGDISAGVFNTGIAFNRGNGAHVHTNSWGNDGTVAYDALCRAIDEQTWNNEDDMICFAVTNQSLLKNPENAKNVLAVGNDGDTPSQNTICTGGAGPTSDGRRKPEIWAPGCATLSSQASTACGTTALTGTSMASPAIGGTALLVRQYYMNGYYPTGTAGTGAPFTPSGALIRATLLNTGQDMAPAGYPSNAEGWGRVKAGDALYFPGDTRKLLVNDKRNADPGALSTGGEDVINVNVLASGEPLRITLSWTEPPAAAGAANAAINDLDLVVEGPAGTYLGNVFDGTGQSTTGGTRDAKNNTEQVLLQSPGVGTYTVRVRGANVAQGTQGYALVATGDIQGGTPPPLIVSLASPIPGLLPPGQPWSLNVTVTPGSQNVVPGSPSVWYRGSASGGFAASSLVSLGGTGYRADFPAPTCTTTPQFYFSAQGDGGATAYSPGNAPASFYSTQVGTSTTTQVYAQSFEGGLPAGWSTSGLWRIGSNCPPGPACDGTQWAYYGQTTCTYNTGATNSGNLTSAAITLPSVPAGGSVTLTYCSAKQSENDPDYDQTTLSVGGTVVDTPGDSATFETRTVDLTSYAGQTVTLTWRFDTVDGVLNDYRGWHVDNVRISATTTGCTPPACYANCDGSTAPPVLNVADFTCFLQSFAAGDSYANCDASTTPPVHNVADFTCFLQKFAAGCP